MAMWATFYQPTRPRNNFAFTYSVLSVVILLCFIAENVRGNQIESDPTEDERGKVGDGLKPMLPTPKLFDDWNSDIPIRSEVLDNLLDFRCRCDPDYNPLSILILHSHPNFQERRNTIRSTWGSTEQCRRHHVILRFVMGRPESIQQADMLIKEMEEYGDTMIGNFTSGIRSTSLQTFLALRWTRKFCHPSPLFLVQAFDNVCMRLDKLDNITNTLLEENSLGHINIIVGFSHASSLVIRDRTNPFYVDAQTFDRDRFPPFCTLSAGFIVPLRMALNSLSELHLEIEFLPFIDKFYGLLAEKYNGTVQHHDAFSHILLQDAGDACILSSKFTAISPSNITEVYNIWKKIVDPDFDKNCNDF